MRERLGDESGVALVLALGIMLVLTIVLTTVITFTAAGARDSHRVNAGQKAYGLAEAGVNNALAVLNANYPDETSPYPGPRCVLNPQPPPANFPGTEPTGLARCPDPSAPPLPPFTSTPDPSRPGETVAWWGRIRRVTGMGLAWIINSTGSVPNPTGPGSAPVTRTVQAKVPVIIGPARDVPPGVLNWFYSATSATALQSVQIRSPFYTRGNLTLGNGVEVYAPLYVTCVVPPAPVPTPGTCGAGAGNILMSQTAQINQSNQGTTVAVGGYLGMETDGPNGNRAGTLAARISESHIVNGCKWGGEAIVAPCELNRTDKVRVYPFVGNQTMPPDPIPQPPVIDWDFWYQYGSPGPAWGCDAGTTPQLENEAAPANLRNNSVPAVFNILQATSYSCRTLSGELTWNATTRTLTVRGTIYIDGSAEIQKTWGGQEPALYQGQGTIYLSGSFLLNNVKLCAVISGTDCNIATNAWDPNVSALIIVAKSKGTSPGTQATTGNNSVEVKSSQFQGVLSGEYNIVSETASVVQGPIISFQGGITLSQTSGASFPEVYFAPSGAPGIPPPPSVLLAPRDYGGG